jgi:hypothetical protein
MMDSKYGLQIVLNTPDALGGIALLLQSKNARLKKKVPKLLAAVACFSEEAHRYLSSSECH